MQRFFVTALSLMWFCQAAIAEPPKRISKNLHQAIDVCVLMAKVRELMTEPDCSYQGRDISSQPYAVLGCDTNAATELTDMLIAQAGIKESLAKTRDGDTRNDYYFGAPEHFVAVCRRYNQNIDLCDFMYPL